MSPAAPSLSLSSSLSSSLSLSSLKSLALCACVCFGLGACTQEEAKETAKETAEQLEAAAKDKGKELADKGKDKGKELAAKAADRAADKAKSWWDDEVPSSGELSTSAMGMIKDGAEAGGGVEGMLVKGEQLAPVAVEVAKSLRGAVDTDLVVEPILQKVDDEQAQAELDAKIQGMPTVETIDGVTVGFKDMTETSTAGKKTEHSYLVLWRKGDRLLGFVYRSKKEIDAQKLIADAPRLIGLVQGAM